MAGTDLKNGTTNNSGEGFPIFLGGIFCSAIAVCYILMWSHFRPHSAAEAGKMSYADLAATLLASTAVLVTILGVFVAILAIWGYVHFQRSIKAAALSYIKDQIERGSIHTQLELMVTNHISEEMNKPDGPLRHLLVERVDVILMNDAQLRAQTGEPNVPVQPDEEFTA